MKNRKKGSDLLAHDLLNQLGVIVGNCDLATERLPRDSEATKHLSNIRDAAQAMAVELKGADLKRLNRREPSGVC